jgi:hypothetical protein
MKSKDQQLLEEAYTKINEMHNGMHNDQSFIEYIAEEMFNIGSRIRSGLDSKRIRTAHEDEADSLRKDAQFLLEHAQEIEQLASNVLSSEREISQEEDEQMITADLANK